VSKLSILGQLPNGETFQLTNTLLGSVKRARRMIGELVNKLRIVLPDLYCYMDEEDVRPADIIRPSERH
jgi:hypothetical protein